MNYMFVLVLATLAACTQATLNYGLRPIYGGGKPYGSVLGGSFGRFGSGYYKPNYYPGRRVGRSAGLGGGLLVNPLGYGGLLGQSGCFLRCGYGEVCVRDSLKGYPYCQRKFPFLGGGSPVLGGFGFGGRRNVCYNYAYPNDCVSTSKLNSISRYTFHEGYCQEFSCNTVNSCKPQGQINNIFTSILDCQQYCRY